MQIRSARAADLDKIVALHSKYLPGFFESMGEKFLADLYSCILRLEPGGFFVAAHGEELIGFIVATFDNGKFSKRLLAMMMPQFALGIVTRAYKFSDHFLSICRKILQTLQLILQRPKTIPTDKIAVLWEIVVHPSYRQRGIGSRLLDHVELYLVAKGKREFLVPVYERDENAIGFYLHTEFRRVEVSDGALGRVYLMKKEIRVD